MKELPWMRAQRSIDEALHSRDRNPRTAGATDERAHRRIDAHELVRENQKLELLLVALHEQTAALNRLCEILSAPTTRTATVELPSGPATMTVHESRAGRSARGLPRRSDS